MCVTRISKHIIIVVDLVSIFCSRVYGTIYWGQLIVACQYWCYFNIAITSAVLFDVVSGTYGFTLA